MESNDDYIILDDDYIILDDEPISWEEWFNKAQINLKKYIESKSSINMYDEPFVNLKTGMPESIGFEMNNEEILGAKLHTDLSDNSKYLRIHINNSYPTCLKFDKKPTWIQRIFLKVLGIKFALEG